MRRLRALWLVALTASVVLLLSLLFAVRQQRGQESEAAQLTSDQVKEALHVDGPKRSVEGSTGWSYTIRLERSDGFHMQVS